MYYYTEVSEYGYTWHYLVLENKGQYYLDGIRDMHRIVNITWEEILEMLAGSINRGGYFGTVLLKLVETISIDLYEKALENKEKQQLQMQIENQRHIEQMRQQEIERKKEIAAARAADDAMIEALDGIIKQPLTNLQRGQALKALKSQLYITVDNKPVLTTFFELITKYGYDRPCKEVDRYTRWGDERATPIVTYLVGNKERGYYVIPGRLGTLLITE